MGLPKGSKNKSGHKASGDRKSQDAKKTNQPKIDWQRVPKKKKQAPHEQGVEQRQAKKQQQAGQEEAALKEQAERLRHVFNHPSNKYGVPGYVDSAKTAHTSCYDETLDVDDTFKFANKVFVNIRRENRVQPYNCSITIMNGQGKVAMSRLKYTKSHDEMRPLLISLREARENTGAPELQRLETDCPTADKSLYETIFPELKKGVVPYTPTSELAALSFGNQDEYRFFNTSVGVNNYVLLKLAEFENMLSNQAACYYGLDGEWNQDSNEKGLALLQLSFQDLPVLVIHLHQLNSFPAQLKNILQMPRMIACSRNIGVDLARLEYHGVKLTQ